MAAKDDSSHSVDEDIVDIVWRAANVRRKAQITIERGGVPTGIVFTVHSLKENEFTDARDQCTYHPRERFGDIRDLTGDVNQAQFHALIVYTATEPEDRARLWDNRAVWQKLSAVNGPDVVSMVLDAGELNGVYSKIEQISGYGKRFDEDLKGPSKPMTPSTE
jgi:hypothetical protein